MAFTVRLHGGPWHGRTVSVEDGRDHIHILAPVVENNPREFREPVKHPKAEPFPTREGMYTIVNHSRDYPHDFEWVGWRSHD